MAHDEHEIPGEHTADTTTESVTRTVSLDLETSQRKNELVREGIAEFQQMASFMTDMLPSFPEHEWTPNHTTMYRVVSREFGDDRTVKSTIAREAQQKVAEAYRSWRENGKPGNRPKFGSGDYLRLSHQDLTIEENEQGWGLKATFIPYNPVWFHIDDGPYQREFLRRVTDDDDGASAGARPAR